MLDCHYASYLADVLIKYKFHIYLILIELQVAQLIKQIGHQIQTGRYPSTT